LLFQLLRNVSVRRPSLLRASTLPWQTQVHSRFCDQELVQHERQGAALQASSHHKADPQPAGAAGPVDKRSSL